jgi:hypothetical protein
MQRSQAAACSAADRCLLSAVCIGIIATLPCAFYLLLSAVCIGNIVIWNSLVILSFGNHWQYCHLVLIPCFYAVCILRGENLLVILATLPWQFNRTAVAPLVLHALYIYFYTHKHK